jgi:hypothetical protein
MVKCIWYLGGGENEKVRRIPEQRSNDSGDAVNTYSLRFSQIKTETKDLRTSALPSLAEIPFYPP